MTHLQQGKARGNKRRRHEHEHAMSHDMSMSVNVDIPVHTGSPHFVFFSICRECPYPYFARSEFIQGSPHFVRRWCLSKLGAWRPCCGTCPPVTQTRNTRCAARNTARFTIAPAAASRFESTHGKRRALWPPTILPEEVGFTAAEMAKIGPFSAVPAMSV